MHKMNYTIHVHSLQSLFYQHKAFINFCTGAHNNYACLLISTLQYTYVTVNIPLTYDKIKYSKTGAQLSKLQFKIGMVPYILSEKQRP